MTLIDRDLLDRDALTTDLRNTLMRYHGCILHNGPGSGACRADIKRTDLAISLLDDHLNLIEPDEVLSVEATYSVQVDNGDGWVDHFIGTDPSEATTVYELLVRERRTIDLQMVKTLTATTRTVLSP